MYTQTRSTITLYKDNLGNFWHYEGKEDAYHKVVVVDYEDGHYTYTYHTCYFTDEEFAKFTKIEVEV